MDQLFKDRNASMNKQVDDKRLLWETELSIKEREIRKEQEICESLAKELKEKKEILETQGQSEKLTIRKLKR